MNPHITAERSPSIWEPSTERIEQSHIKAFADYTGQPLFPYERFHRWSVSRLSEFWSAVWDYAGHHRR